MSITLPGSSVRYFVFLCELCTQYSHHILVLQGIGSLFHLFIVFFHKQSKAARVLSQLLPAVCWLPVHQQFEPRKQKNMSEQLLGMPRWLYVRTEMDCLLISESMTLSRPKNKFVLAFRHNLTKQKPYLLLRISVGKWQTNTIFISMVELSLLNVLLLYDKISQLHFNSYFSHNLVDWVSLSSLTRQWLLSIVHLLLKFLQ